MVVSDLTVQQGHAAATTATRKKKNFGKLHAVWILSMCVVGWVLFSGDDVRFSSKRRGIDLRALQRYSFRVDTPYLTRPQIRELTTLKVMLFVTTHLSPQHMQALEYIWPSMVAKSHVLKNADVLFYTSDQPPELDGLLHAAFPHNHNVTVVEYSNDGKQQGAIKAITDAIEKHWFDSYDWVIRVNPDVILRNETWIASTMLHPEAWGILVDCTDLDLDGPEPRVHTDFFAIQPKYLNTNEKPKNPKVMKNAEYHATFLFKNIWSTGHAAILPDNDLNRNFCRVKGEQSSVVHDHAWLSREILHQQTIGSGK